MFNKTEALEDTVAVDSTPTMAAPVIELDGEGMFSIDDCPTKYEGLEIVKHKGEYNLSSIDIMRDGQLLRSFNFTDDDYVTRDEVHFLDANRFISLESGTIQFRERIRRWQSDAQW